MSLFDDASLVLIPDGAKDGTLYSVKPTDGTGDFTFTRGSNLAATRVDENGLIEKGRENLLLQSNQFDNSYWTKTNATLTSGQSGVYGSNDAFKVDFVGGTYSSVQRNQTFSIGVGTLSFYLKAGTHNYIQILNSPSGAHYANFDISNGVTGNKGALIIDSSITDVGNGWYRCSMTANFSTQTIYFVWPVNSLTSGWAELVSTSGNYYIQDAQLEAGLVATDYIETTTTTAQAGILEDMPRLDYSGGTCPALLLEPQRTNVVTNSEYISNYSSANTTITQNYGISPEGVKNSARVQFSGTGYIAFGVITYTNEVTSMYVKGTAGEKIRFGKGANVAQGALYTLTGDWQRIVYDVGSPSATFIISNFNGATANDFEVYGLQHEEGSYPTSYIPTYGTSVTRGAESCVVNGATSSIGQTEGTMFLDFVYEDNDGDFYGSYVANATGFTDFLGWRISDNKTSLDVLVRYNNTYQALDSVASVFVVGNTYKVAMKYSSGNIKVFVNNTEKFSSTATYTTPSVPLSKHTISGNSLNLVDSYQLDNVSKINQALLFPTALSDADCITLTT